LRAPGKVAQKRPLARSRGVGVEEALMEDSAPGPAVDIAEAAELTGLSKKALQRRIERGSLPSVKRGSKRHIPVMELKRQGLLSPEGGADRAAAGEGVPLTPPAGEVEAVKAVARELAEKAEELGRYKALAASAVSQRQAETEARERLEAEVHRLRAELQEAEAKLARRSRWPWRRRRAEEPDAA